MLVQNNGRLNELMEAVKSGKIVCHLTEPNEIKAILGEPQGENWDNDGAMRRLTMYFPTVEIHFSKFRMYKDDPLTLRSIIVRGTKIDIGGEGPPALRNVNDLRKLDDLHDISLKDLDLTDQGDYLKKMDFYTSTLWPPSNKLPPGFDPQKLLEEGKNPGLGIRSLHGQGINGKGIGIAILDQPLLLGHEEYTSRLIRYDATRTYGRYDDAIGNWLKLKMHGPPVVGIAVGKTCGVAPGAFVFYYAGRRTDVHEDQADWINEIINYNRTAEYSQRIRVISISANPESASNNDAFLKARKTTQFLPYSGLTLIEGKDPDKPESYKGGGPDDVLLIPTRNKTIASYRGINTYRYSRGLAESWAPPYIAGLAALAFQVNPDLQPQTIVEQLVKTATHTEAGPVVNPRGFIESVKRLNKKVLKHYSADKSIE
jgi:subtilisin family serine protease